MSAIRADDAEELREAAASVRHWALEAADMRWLVDDAAKTEVMMLRLDQAIDRWRAARARIRARAGLAVLQG